MKTLLHRALATGKQLSLLLAAALCLAGCEHDGHSDGVPYKLAEHYFLRNDVNARKVPAQIKTQAEFNRYFGMAAVMGGLAGGGADGDIAALGRFALNLGLAFQYEDDILDGDSPFGRDETERRAKAATDAALAALGELKGDTSALAEIAKRLLGRKS